MIRRFDGSMIRGFGGDYIWIPNSSCILPSVLSISASRVWRFFQYFVVSYSNSSSNHNIVGFLAFLLGMFLTVNKDSSCCEVILFTHVYRNLPSLGIKRRRDEHCPNLLFFQVFLVYINNHRFFDDVSIPLR